MRSATRPSSTARTRPGPIRAHPPSAFTRQLSCLEVKAHRDIVQEAAFLYACLVRLKRDPSQRVIGTGLYFNLLVLTQISRLAVQQVDETGFDQFQKYTLPARERGLKGNTVPASVSSTSANRFIRSRTLRGASRLRGTSPRRETSLPTSLTVILTSGNVEPLLGAA